MECTQESNLEQIKIEIGPFTTCDISDGLCALSILNHSLLDTPLMTLNVSDQMKKVVGLAFTAEFRESANVPHSHPIVPNHVDTCPASAVLLIKTPSNAPNAVWGGLMSARARAIGIAGIITDGRIRDLDEISGLGVLVWAKGKSTMGLAASPYCKLAAVGHDFILNESTPHPVPIKCGKTLVVADEHGVVCFDVDLVPQLVAYCRKRVQVDNLCMQDLKEGKSIVDTFKARR